MEEQLQKKQSNLDELLSVFNSQALPPVESERYGFRNKAKMLVGGSVMGPVLGIVSGPKIQNLADCPLHHKEINQFLTELPEFITEYNLVPYDIEKRIGELKAVIVLRSEHSGELMLRWILRSKEGLDRLKKLTPVMQRKFPLLKVVTVNLQPEPKAVLWGKEEIVLTDGKMLKEKIGPYTLNVPPQAFTQTNMPVAQKLYAAAEELVKKCQPKLVWDLYCGIGPFAFFASPHAQEVVGIELEGMAIEAAQLSKEQLQRNNLTFKAMSSEDFIIGPSKAPDCLIVNPPRAGIQEKTLKSIIDLKISKIIYSSCNPDTLVRDLKFLCPHYKIETHQLFDMFPLTPHMEVLVSMQRISK